MSSSSNIPETLKAIPHWVTWRIEERSNGKKTKPPFDPKKPGFVYASSTDPKTWGTFKDALNHRITNGAEGLGFVVTRDDDIVGIDLDDCVNPKTSEVEEWAQIDAKAINSYTEYSPSGEGLRIFVRGNLPQAGKRTGNFEIYGDKHYLTVTGNHVPGTPLTIEKRQQEIDVLFAKYFPTSKTSKGDVDQEPSGNSDELESHQDSEQTDSDEVLVNTDQIIQIALNAKNGEKFRRLWEGDISGYPSHSEADLALCKLLAFWCRKNPDAMDSLFRASKLHRPKWDEPRGNKTYGRITIDKAIATTKNTYKPRKNTALLEIAEDVELFHSTDKEAWVTFKIDSHYETSKLNEKDCKNFQIWLSHEYYKIHNKLPKQSAISDLFKLFEMKALREGREYRLNVRIGRYRRKIYLDLCNDDWEIVKVSKKGWRIINAKDCPVKFRREAGMKALPRPKKGGDLNDLRKILNLSDYPSFVLATAWLVGSLNTEGPFPLMLLTGEQGSTKSSFARFSRSLIDPSMAPLRSLPFKEHDMIISANNSAVLAYDNISYLKRHTADALCRIATGSGHAARKLYTDSGEVILSASRPIILNGIELHSHFHDLMARCISLDLPRIRKKKRKTEKQLWKRFNNNKLSAGRVQTPTLALIINREKEIENFKNKTEIKLEIPLKGQFLNIELSPDGQKLAFEQYGGNMYVLDLSNNKLTELGHGNRPQWSPDNESLVFMISEDDGHNLTNSDIYVINIDGTGKTNITPTNKLFEMNPSWSPDGKKIVFDEMLSGIIFSIDVEKNIK